MNKEYIQGERRFNEKDFYLDHEVLLEENKVNVYVVMGSWDEIFGIQVQEGESINVYTNYDFSAQCVEDDLVLVWKQQMKDRVHAYKMSVEEKSYMTEAVIKYLKKNGIILPKIEAFTIENGEKSGEICIGSESSSGCKYQDIFTKDDLKACVSRYIDDYI